MKRWTLALGALLALSLSATACGGKKEATPQADAASQQPGTTPPATADAGETPEAPAAQPDAGAAPAPEAPAPDAQTGQVAPPVHDKATMQRAYVEIYCAQRKGEAQALLDLYAKYGFTDPAAWTKAWTEHAKDAAWVAQITSEAISACP